MQLKQTFDVTLKYECETIINSTYGTTYLFRLLTKTDKVFEKVIRVTESELPKIIELTKKGE